MPYVDPARRRQCQRESKRRQRWRQKRIGPLLGTKIYLFLRFPNIRITGRDSFYMNPFLITSSREIQGLVEAHPGFGITIFPLQIDFSLIGPIVDDDDDE